MSQIKILLVDDREDNLVSIEAILAEKDYKFIKASSGRQALKILLTEYDFTLILMDVKMPDLSGFETATMIYEREKLRHIPIIFITAYSYSDEKVYEGYKTGAVDYIYKPIDPQLLRAKVAVFVDLYRKNHQLMQQEKKLLAVNNSLELEIAERKRSEEKIIDLNKQLRENIETLEAANSDLARFAYVASHDLQEPLRKIQTFGDLLKDKYYDIIDDEGRDYVERMQNASKRMQTLIKDILSYSRLTSKDTFKSCDTKGIIHEILNDLEIAIQEAGAEISFKGNFPEIEGNSSQLRQLFQNIISNALKFSRQGGSPKILITSKVEKGVDVHGIDISRISHDFCSISIKDNGIGFDDQYSEQIFTLFKRLNDSTKYKGTGIGLAICKKIVEQHKGYISAKGKINEGALFTITLPLNHSKYDTTIQQISENTYSG